MLITLVTNPALSPPQNPDRREDTGLQEFNVLAGKKDRLSASSPTHMPSPPLIVCVCSAEVEEWSPSQKISIFNCNPEVACLAIPICYNILDLDLCFLQVLYLTLLHLPPLRFNCVRGCRDRTQDCCDFWHWKSDALTTRLDLIHCVSEWMNEPFITFSNTRSHSVIITLYRICGLLLATRHF